MMTKKPKGADTQHPVWPIKIIDANDGSGDAILVLPDGLCNQLGWKIGDKFDVSAGTDKEIIIKRID